ncbi:MAG TPA: DUF2726 domain-containing protein [Desulfuromonadaceae bacterium]|jgi:hypothetical protein
MNLIIAVIIIAVVVALLAALKSKKVLSDSGLAFSRCDALFTPAERSFLGVLEQALDSRYRVFGKVRLADIVMPAKGQTPSKRTSALNKLRQKHVDFVICLISDLSVVGVVELDDKSHEREERAERDVFVDQVLDMAKIPVIHFPAQKGYALQDVRTRLAEKIPAVNDSVVAPKVQEEPDPVQPAIAVSTQATSVLSVVTAPVCPKCESEMIKRQAVKGQHAGKTFWACSAYPKCRQVVAID